MLNIAVFTGTRAEYGLLYWLMKTIDADSALNLQLIVGGMHLSPQFGNTVEEIIADGFSIDAKVEMLLSSNTPTGIAKSMGLGLIGFAEALERLKPDVLIILGDRFEALAIAQAALVLGIPIAHIHGGELTMGAYDEMIRHAISKMAAVHFVAAEPYRQRLIRMGEAPARVFNFGALGLEQVSRTKLYDFEALKNELGIPLQKPYMLITLHPVTVAKECAKSTCEAIFQVLADYPQYQVLFTYPNADNGGYTISGLLEAYCQQSERAFMFRSLGTKRYLSVVAHAELVLGNSSSGLIEVPAFAIPTVNIGQRQQGRLAATSVIHADISYQAMSDAVKLALSVEFKAQCAQAVNPYGMGNTASQIVEVLKHHPITTVKPFYEEISHEV